MPINNSKTSTEIPCHHIYTYYDYRWHNHHCIGWNLLRRGYLEWAEGRPASYNNLYDVLTS